jgi:tetratricopeptide (TPR) repeat protein
MPNARLAILAARGPFLALIAALGLAALIYWPGLSGPFLFDDYPNLEGLGRRGPIESFELLRLYLKGGFAGPTGRPLSLLSFLIDANNWPADAWPFKRTNLIIHLLAGAVLFGATRKLLLSLGRSREAAAWTAVLSAGLWLLNPFLVSTTLYAVQRMTLLSALFMIAGLWCYLHGRALLASRPRHAYLTLCGGLPLFTLLAVLSKENGALLPLLVLAMETVLRKKWTSPGPTRLYTIIFLIVPSAALVGYLLQVIPRAENLYAVRDFTLAERLLSQARYLWDYLYHLYVPHIQTQGLFQDGRAVSQGLLEPWTTLPAICGLLALVAGAWICRMRWPLLSFALLFFFAGHLLESTTIPLEMYFEHRNYLPAAFLFLPVAAGLHEVLRRKVKPAAVGAIGVVLAAVYALATWQHAALWGDEDRLLLVWAQMNPTSVRAQTSAAQTWLRRNDAAKAVAILEDADRRLPDNALLISGTLMARAELGTLTLAQLEEGARRIRQVPFDAQAIRALEELVNDLNRRGRQPERAKVLNDLLQGIRHDVGDTIPPVYKKTYYLQGLLLAGQGQPEEALPYFVQALEIYNSVDAGMRMVSDVALLGQFRAALALLSHVEALLGTLDDEQLEVSRGTFESDIARLRASLLMDLDQEGAADRLSSLSPESRELTREAAATLESEPGPVIDQALR